MSRNGLGANAEMRRQPLRILQMTRVQGSMVARVHMPDGQ